MIGQGMRSFRNTALLSLVAFAGAAPQVVSNSFTRDRGGIVRGARAEKRLALEFTGDQFAEGGNTILDALKRRGIKAAFFLTGRFLRNPAFRPIIERIRDEGHYLGPHSDGHLLYAGWDSPPKLLVTEAEFRADLAANLREIERFGIPKRRVRFFLPPYEHYTPEIVHWAKAAGLTLINFTPGTRSNTDYMEDGDPRFVPAEEIVQSILEAERTDPDGLNGFLLLMHVGAGPKRKRDHPYERLGSFLDTLRARGYQFVRVDELLVELKP